MIRSLLFIIAIIFLKNCDGTVYLNCEDVARKTSVSSAASTFNIDPTGAASGGEVTCEAVNLHAVNTIVHHDSETRTSVNGYEGYGAYSKSPLYPLSEAQFAALRTQGVCKQYLKFECLAMAKPEQWLIMQGDIRNNYDNTSYSNYPPCTCIFKETCDTGANSCICNQNSAWSADEGYLTEEVNIPVKTLKYGDTGDVSEDGYHTLGPFTCLHSLAPDLRLNGIDVTWMDRSKLIDGDNTTCLTLNSWTHVTSRVYLMYELSGSSVTVSVIGTDIPTEDGSKKTSTEQGILVYVDKSAAEPGYHGKFFACSRVSVTNEALTSLEYICTCPYGKCEAVMIHMFNNIGQPQTASICEMKVGLHDIVV